jgi:hypothetical protein
MTTISETVFNHVTKLAETHITGLSGVLQVQREHISSWGRNLRTEASSAAAVVQVSLQDAAKNLRDSGSEFLARLDLIRHTWKEQTDLLKTQMEEQTRHNQSVVSEMQTAAQNQAQASQSLATTLNAIQSALTATAGSVQSLESGLVRLADSSLEATATALVKSLEKVGEESESITTTLNTLTASTRATAESQASVHDAVRQLHDLKLVETLASFRDALVRHATLVDKLNTGLKITVG